MTAVALSHAPATAVARADADLGALTEPEFERALTKLDTRKKRMARILDSYLVPNAHYGNPVTKSGRPVFQKPILYRAGADELGISFGLEVVTEVDRPDSIVEGPDYCSVTVRRAICDRTGRVIDRTVASCTTKEKRFKKTDGSGYTFEDAREALNDLHAMAEKRAKVRLVVTALGIGAWLAAEEEMESAIEQDEKPLTPWTDEEKRTVYAAANAKGIGKRAFLAMVQSTLGRDKVGTGADVQQLLAVIATWEKPAKTDATQTTEPQVTAEPDPTPAPSADVEYHETSAPAAPDSRDVFGKGNAGPVLPGELAIAQAQAGELPLGDAAPKRTRNAVREGA